MFINRKWYLVLPKLSWLVCNYYKDKGRWTVIGHVYFTLFFETKWILTYNRISYHRNVHQHYQLQKVFHLHTQSAHSISHVSVYKWPIILTLNHGPHINTIVLSFRHTLAIQWDCWTYISMSFWWINECIALTVNKGTWWYPHLKFICLFRFLPHNALLSVFDFLEKKIKECPW